ncbi:MAG: EMC3/TMCO1 family protein [Candidatus Lokiarchaeota archaeon]
MNLGISFWDLFFKYPPGSMIFVLLISTAIALITAGLTKLLVDTEELERKQTLIKDHQEEKQKIIELADKDRDKYRKMRKRWERKDVMIQKTQSRIGLQRLKPTCVTILPMFIFFAIIRGVFGLGPVALTPMNANHVPLIGGMLAGYTNNIDLWTVYAYGVPRTIGINAGWISFTGWYFLCSFGMNTLLQRLLKLQTQASGGMEQMLGGSKAKGIDFPDV